MSSALPTGHDSGGGVGAVRRHRDDAHIALLVAICQVVLADGHEPRILATGAAVGLQRNCIKTCDLCQLVRQVLQGRISAMSLGLCPDAGTPHCRQ